MKYEKITIYSDGGSRGNPGKAGIGAILKDENKKNISEISEYLGIATNNQAEYTAIIKALEKAHKLGAQNVECYLDSELIVKQINGDYKVKNKGLIPLFLQLTKLKNNFQKISFTHIRRELNKESDKLANEAMDKN